MSPRRSLSSLLVAAALLAGGSAVQAAKIPRSARATMPLTIYASVQGVGVFKASGTGDTWQGPSTLPSDVISLATVDPAHWRVVYAGVRGGGVYASRDGGATWTQTGLAHNRAAAALMVDANDPDRVIAGTRKGVWRSEDDGATWTAATGISGAVTALAQAPSASITPTMYAAGNGRAWMSTSSGQQWTSLGRGLPSRVTITGLAVGIGPTATLYAATAQGLWQLSSKGTWSRVGQGLPVKAYSAVVSDGSHVYAVDSAETTLYTSSDGTTWSRSAISGLSGGVTTLAEDPQQPPVLVAGDANGNVGVSADGGATWNAPSGGVAGTVGSPILALALIHRQTLPVDGVPDPHRADALWFSNNGGHTLQGPFLAYWQAQPDAADTIGYPASEQFPASQQFSDHAYDNVTAQFFDRMELLLQPDGTVAPAPLGLELAPASYLNSAATYAVDAHFQAFWKSNGGTDFFGPPITPAFTQTIGDGTSRAYLVQYFRNARLEYHPELAGVGTTVQVSALAQQALQKLGWT